jgi:cbb3-type cytochrome oxidase subunit 3
MLLIIFGVVFVIALIFIGIWLFKYYRNKKKQEILKSNEIELSLDGIFTSNTPDFTPDINESPDEVY